MKTILTTISAPGKDPITCEWFAFRIGLRELSYDWQGALVLKPGTEIRIRRIKDMLVVSAATTRKKVQP